MLIAEDLLLLLVDDESGKVDFRSHIDHGLAGAVLVELAAAGRVDVAGAGEEVKKGRVVVRDTADPGHPVLADALATLAELAGARPEKALEKLSKGLRARLVDGLVERGVLRREKHKVLGIFPVERIPAQDSTHEGQVRQNLLAVLAGAQPDERSGALISLLSALHALTGVLDVPDKRAARKRAKEISQGQWAAEAVRKAVDAVNSAVVAAVVASTAAANSGS